MTSPFPGMDPYLEDPGIWTDFPMTLIVAMRAELNARLPSGYVASADRHVWSDARKGRPFLKITDSFDRHVVSAVELLSPTNKTPGDDHNDYLEKREEYFASGVNLVEINLLRKGRNPPLGDVALLDYYILAARAKELPRAEIWSFSVRQSFPDFALPLRSGEKIAFNLRPSVDRAYQEARYERDIDYSSPPIPPLDEVNKAWAEKLIRRRH